MEKTLFNVEYNSITDETTFNYNLDIDLKEKDIKKIEIKVNEILGILLLSKEESESK